MTEKMKTHQPTISRAMSNRPLPRRNAGRHRLSGHVIRIENEKRFSSISASRQKAVSRPREFALEDDQPKPGDIIDCVSRPIEKPLGERVSRADKARPSKSAGSSSSASLPRKSPSKALFPDASKALQRSTIGGVNAFLRQPGGNIPPVRRWSAHGRRSARSPSSSSTRTRGNMFPRAAPSLKESTRRTAVRDRLRT